MSDRLFFERMLANISGVTVKQIKTGRYTTEEEERIQKAIAWIKSKPFIHMYNPQMSLEQLYTICRGQKHKIGLQFVVYDYIKSDVADANQQYNELGNKCDFLKNNIAGDLELSVLAGAQLNRQNQLADSDKLERYASVSVKWEDKTPEEYSADGNDCGNYKLSIKLNRLGEQMMDGDYIDMAFDGNRMRIEQAKQHTKPGDLPCLS
jgi:replicative DNA helicase